MTDHDQHLPKLTPIKYIVLEEGLPVAGDHDCADRSGQRRSGRRIRRPRRRSRGGTRALRKLEVASPFPLADGDTVMLGFGAQTDELVVNQVADEECVQLMASSRSRLPASGRAAFGR